MWRGGWTAPASPSAGLRRPSGPSSAGWTCETLLENKPTGQSIALDPPAAGRLAEIAVPVTAIVGLLDGSSTAQAADALVAGVAGARRIDLSGVAHMPNLERPEWFTETLLGFLAEVG